MKTPSYMERKTIIVLKEVSEEEFPTIETWGNLKKACEAKGWSYNTMQKKALPCEWKGWHVYRCEFR